MRSVPKYSHKSNLEGCTLVGRTREGCKRFLVWVGKRLRFAVFVREGVPGSLLGFNAASAWLFVQAEDTEEQLSSVVVLLAFEARALIYKHGIFGKSCRVAASGCLGVVTQGWRLFEIGK